MNGLESRIKGLEEHIEKLYKTIEGWEKLARDKDEIIKKYEQQVKNRELYKLKTKILRSKHISDQLREELANDVFEIEKLVNKTNDIHSVSQSWLFLDCRDDGTWLVKHSESKKVEWSGDSKQNALEYIYRHTMCHVC